jgi:hypothetical protein
MWQWRVFENDGSMLFFVYTAHGDHLFCVVSDDAVQATKELWSAIRRHDGAVLGD